MEQKMAPLPSNRMVVGRPFRNVGVDFAGPLTIKAWKGRNSKMHKAYIAVFVCFSSKAVHLDLVTDLTAECFLACFRRFVARRSAPDIIFSDNGSNFLKAGRMIRELQDALKDETIENSIKAFMAGEKIEWRYIPARSPHFGGLWEAAVRSMKAHLQKQIGLTALTYEELQTLLCTVEYCLNSRPLGLSLEDPTAVEVLTPFHFLVLGQVRSNLEYSALEEEPRYDKRWFLVKRLAQNVWSRWKCEYINQLQELSKWKKTTKDLTLGAIVLIKDEDLPPAKWPLATVTSLHLGRDGHVRVVSLKTSHGQFKRAITKLVLLPIFGSDAEAVRAPGNE